MSTCCKLAAIYRSLVKLYFPEIEDLPQQDGKVRAGLDHRQCRTHGELLGTLTQTGVLDRILATGRKHFPGEKHIGLAYGALPVIADIHETGTSNVLKQS